ncbi:hypothetical protein NUW54_g4498 [Trametes sanguinea]|uniref:Uncharacterized protein n=1 Tax=Trametes sanguinea TaxID=158606 RepID=A0ACC1PXS8_9APHY|nr:hypothetical protein NUW54_g4498 [Trametes sanguinea]
MEAPWTHPLYRQAFVQVQAELATEREGEDEVPASVAEVEAEVDELADDEVEVAEAAAPEPRTPQAGREDGGLQVQARASCGQAGGDSLAAEESSL